MSQNTWSGVVSRSIASPSRCEMRKLLEKPRSAFSTASIAEPSEHLRQHLAPDDGIGDALALAVLLALEMVTGDRDAGVVETYRGHDAGLGEHQHAGTGLRDDLQHDRRVRALVTPIPVVRVNEMALASRRRQGDRASAAIDVVRPLARFSETAVQKLGAGVDGDDVFERDFGALSQGAHLFGDTGIGFLDARCEAPGRRSGECPLDAFLGEYAPIDVDAPVNAAGSLAAVLQADVARATRNLNEGEGCRLFEPGSTHRGASQPRALRFAFHVHPYYPTGARQRRPGVTLSYNFQPFIRRPSIPAVKVF